MMVKFKKKGFVARHLMPLAQALENNKLKAFMIMYCIWLIDLGSTAIALGVFSNVLEEGNPIAASFFDLGIIGWFGWMIVCAGLIIFLLYLPNIFLKIDIWIFGKKMRGERLKRNKIGYTLLRLMSVFGIIITETSVIILNTYSMFGAI